MGRPRKSHGKFINHDIDAHTDLERIEKIAEVRKLEARAERKHFPTLAERLAQSTVLVRNYKFHKAEEHFKNEARLWTVDLYFPYAVGGELLIDQVSNETEAKECARKKAVLEKMGYRYLILSRTTTEEEALLALEG